MGDTITPYELNTLAQPGADTQLPVQSQLARLIASRLPPALLAGITGDPAGQTIGGRIVPGVLQSNVAGLGTMGTDIYNAVNKLQARVRGVPVSPPVDPPEFVQNATLHTANILQNAQRMIPTAVAPEGRVESGVADATDQAGMSLPLGGIGGVRALVGRIVPPAVRTVSNAIAPFVMSGLVAPKSEVAIKSVGAGLGQLGDDPKQIQTNVDGSRPSPAPSVELDTTGFDQLHSSGQDTTQTPPQKHVDPQMELDTTGFPGDADPSAFVPKPQMPNDSAFTGRDMFALAALPLVAFGLRAPLSSVWRGATASRRAADAARFNEIVGQRTGDPNYPRPADYDPTNPEPIPTPNIPGTGLANATEARTLDAAARVNAITEQYVTQPDAQKQLRSAVSGIGDTVSAKTKLGEFLATGMDWLTGTRTPSVNRWARRVASSDLDDTERATLNRVLNYADAIDDRQELLRQHGTSGPASSIMTTTFPEISTGVMQQEIAAAQANPRIGPFMDEYRNIQSSWLRLANVGREFVPDADAARMQSIRNSHLSRTTPEGRVLGLFITRPLEEGVGASVNDTPVWVTLPQQAAKLTRAMDLNTRDTMWIRAIDAAQQANPTLPKLITRIRTPDGGPVGDETRMIHTIGTRQGIESWEFHDPQAFEYFSRGDNTLPLGSSIAQKFNSVSQATITGPLAALSGYPFSPVNFVRTIQQAATERPQGTSAGLIDKGVNTLTGNRFGYRGLDPTTIPLAAANVVGNWGSLAVKAFADTLERGSGPLAKSLASIMGRQNVLNMVDIANDFYTTTHLHSLRSQGIGLQSGGITPSVRGTETLGGVRSLVAQAINPAKTASSSPTFEDVPELYKPEASSSLIHIRKFLRDANEQIHSGGLSYYNRLNRDQSIINRASDTGQLVGSPGTEGTSVAIRRYARTVPYLNPTLQGMRRTYQSYRDAPFATVAGKVMMYAPLVIAERYLAMAGGPDHQHTLDNVLTPEQKANGLYMMTGASPQQYSVLSPPQTDRPYIVAMREILRHITSADDAQHDPDSRGTITRGLEQFMSSYIDHGTAASMLYSVTQNLDPLIQLPALAQAGLAALGHNVQPQINRMVDAFQNNRSVIGSVDRPINPAYPLPGQDTVHDAHSDPGAMMNVIANGFGNLAKVISEITHETAKAHTLGEAWDRAWDAMSQNIKDKNMMFNNVLFTNTAPLLARGNYSQQQVMNTLNQLRTMSGMKTGADQQGSTRKGGESVPVTGESLYPNDPQMQEVFGRATQLRNYMERTVLKQITDLDKQRQQGHNTRISQDDMRRENNDIAAQIRAKYAEAAEMIRIANQQISDVVGVPVNLGQHINWSQGSAQFIPHQTLETAQQYPYELDTTGFH